MADKAKTTEATDIEALKAQLLAEIRAELAAEKTQTTAAGEAKAVPDAEDERRKAEEAWLNEYVERTLFKDGKDYKDDVFVAVNGENCRIQRGKPVRIKRKFALVLDQGREQDVLAAENAEKQQQDYAQQARALNI